MKKNLIDDKHYVGVKGKNFQVDSLVKNKVSIYKGLLIALFFVLILLQFSSMLPDANAASYYSLTIQSPTGSGWTSPSTGTRSYSSGTSVRVTATASSGYKFDHWIKDGNDAGTSNPIYVSMYSAHTLRAVFVRTTIYTLTIQSPSWIRLDKPIHWHEKLQLRNQRQGHSHRILRIRVRPLGQGRLRRG